MKVTISKAQVMAKVQGAWKKNLFALSSEILQDCNEYVKRTEKHTMRDSSLSHSKLNEGRIIWDTPYAKRQYWEIQTALTPGTTWRWFETAKNAHMGKWQEKAQRGFIDNL